MPEGDDSTLACHGAVLSADNFYHMFGKLDDEPHGDAELRVLAEKLVQKVEEIDPNEKIPAGYTYFGQMIAHDLSNRKGGRNERSSSLDLDGIYGRDDEQHLDLLHEEGGIRQFRIGHNLVSGEEDLWRNSQTDEPIIPDKRNDFHFIICQYHLAFIKFHHALQQKIASSPEAAQWSTDEVFRAAKKVVTHYYQRVIVDDFLRRVCDPELVEKLWGAPGPEAAPVPLDGVLDGLVCAPEDPSQLPLEFVLAGFRFGHAQVRPNFGNEPSSGYRLNKNRRISIFGRRGDPDDPPGRYKALPFNWTIQWDRFLKMSDDGEPQFSRKIGPSIIGALAPLPLFTLASPDPLLGERNLAMRTLLAGRKCRIVTGQQAAAKVREIYRAMQLPRVDALSPEEAGQEDPLWYYVLREADEQAGGERLGPVGSWIVAYTITEVLRHGRGAGNGSFEGRREPWYPQVGHAGQPIELADIIRHAGRPVTFQNWKDYTGSER